MEFGFVTDELSQDPREAIETALAWNIKRFEIRFVNGGRFPNLPAKELDRLLALREEYAVQYTAVSPGFFKCPLSDGAHLEYALGDGLTAAVEFMRASGTRLLICFSFDREPGAEKQAAAYLERLADRLAEHGLRGAIENEAEHFCHDPEAIVAMLRRLNHPALGSNWDLANLKTVAADGYPRGYELVKPFVVNVHAKDVIVDTDDATAWRPIGDGVCNWRGQLKALAQDKLVEHVTIENHCGPLKEVGQRNLETLKAYLHPAGA